MKSVVQTKPTWISCVTCKGMPLRQLSTWMGQQHGRGRVKEQTRVDEVDNTCIARARVGTKSRIGKILGELKDSILVCISHSTTPQGQGRRLGELCGRLPRADHRRFHAFGWKNWRHKSARLPTSGLLMQPSQCSGLPGGVGVPHLHDIPDIAATAEQLQSFQT